jgi:hypothetical protein
VLVDFYCERLSDTASVPELLQGIDSLTRFNAFNNENSIKVSKSYVFYVNGLNHIHVFFLNYIHCFLNIYLIEYLIV